MLAKTSQGSFSTKRLKTGRGIGISSLNKSTNNFATVHATFAQTSSIGAAWRKKIKNLNAVTKQSF
jgi:hypothetical protein